MNAFIGFLNKSAGAGFYVVPLLLCMSGIAQGQQQAAEYQREGAGTREFFRGDLVIKALVEKSNLGSSEVEVGEITFPAGSQGGGHQHGSIEIFYVVSGIMEHVVNDVPHRLTPGMVGIVRPHDTVAHRVVGDEPVKAVVIWAPGGEIQRISSIFEERPLSGQ